MDFKEMLSDLTKVLNDAVEKVAPKPEGKEGDEDAPKTVEAVAKAAGEIKSGLTTLIKSLTFEGKLKEQTDEEKKEGKDREYDEEPGDLFKAFATAEDMKTVGQCLEQISDRLANLEGRTATRKSSAGEDEDDPPPHSKTNGKEPVAKAKGFWDGTVRALAAGKVVKLS